MFYWLRVGSSIFDTFKFHIVRPKVAAYGYLSPTLYMLRCLPIANWTLLPTSVIDHISASLLLAVCLLQVLRLLSVRHTTVAPTFFDLVVGFYIV